MNEKLLSRRLQMVASYLPRGAKFADIGSDHAYLPCYVCLQDPTATAIAGELNEGPFQSARKEVESNDLSARIAVRKGDGLSVLSKDEVDQIVIAGMGGTLITNILEEGKDKLGRTSRIIVQPNVDAKSLRKWFVKYNYQITAEEIIEEAGHIYEVIVAEKNDTGNELHYSERETLFGPYLMKEKSPVFKKKWIEEKAKRDYVKREIQKAANPDNDKIAALELEILWIEEVLKDD
ncbi:tRNA (adenine22-N1)-methyltransferase [Thalassobacillus cyri]|uniref:tRNA (Adenine22-N1)-methyltransferase n=1 Tax=Thalassobacillus cyri TaxID=571932 RepID=A0A1H4FHT3_9BACI|nr:tRNA (adenine(22)-N(1))-methyltransferase TrmK [Thalassobacillus cyri]SEA96909.1 tRNA (adenine22-N1)-methyltransferase [Thalassobacillus cyri]